MYYLKIMIKKKFMLAVLSVCLIATACGKTTEEESLEFGDIDTSKTYGDTYENHETLVDRVEPLDMKEYYTKIPISITEEPVRGELKDFYGVQNGAIDRIKLNGVSFDINEMGILYGGSYSVEDGIFCISFPDNSMRIKVAQIYSGSSTIFDEDSLRMLNNIKQEYYETYDEASGYMRKEYGDVYTYDKYVTFFKENPSFMRDLSAYSAEQIFEVATSALGMEYNYSDFMVNEMPSNFDYSDFYESYVTYQLYEDVKETKICVKRSDDGVFVFWTEYETGVNIDESEEEMFSPSAIINFSQNHFILMEEPYQKYIDKINQEKGF